MDSNSSAVGLPRKVLVLAPGTQAAFAGNDPGYDTEAYRAEMARWFEPLGVDWSWAPVSIGEVEATVAGLAAHAPDVVFNLCDGDEWDGFPGLSAVRALERSGLNFTGADSAFYALSTSKLAMKAAFAKAGVAAPSAVRLADPERDAARVRAEVGFPCIVKLDVGADGMGLDPGSVVADEAELIAQAMKLRAADPRRGVFAEAFVGGREFTALVVADADYPDGVRAYWPVEKHFSDRIPERRRIMYAGCRDRDEGAPHVVYAAAPADMVTPVGALARAAFRALDGTGYARADIRADPATGRLMVLEMNACCGLGVGEPTITIGLEAEGVPYAGMIAAILRDALARGAGRSRERVATAR
jgi:D-alanine-D-alanine ligase